MKQILAKYRKQMMQKFQKKNRYNKKVWCNHTNRNNHEDNGAVIIEAAVSLPIFMFLIFSILFTINMSIVQCRMQIALNETAKEISQYSYFYSLTGLNNLSAINADAAADTKQQVSDVVSGITTVYGSFENMVTDVADARTCSHRCK